MIYVEESTADAILRYSVVSLSRQKKVTLKKPSDHVPWEILRRLDSI